MNRQLLILLLLLVASIAKAQVTANFTATPRTGCAPMVVTFTSTSTGSPTSYSWNFGNGLTSSAANPVVPYTTPGIYTVTLTVSSASGSNTKTQSNYITVNQVPTVSLSATPLTVCPGAPVTFSSNVSWNAAGSGTYAWDFGDGGTSALSSPVHSYAGGGTYTVKLTGINSVNCPRTDTQANLIFVYPRPKATFDASDTAVCTPAGTTTFTAVPAAGTGPYTYTWDFGDFSTGSGNPVTHAYGAVGSYTVKLYITDANGCKDSLIRTNYIRRRNIATGFTATASACVGASITATNTTGSTVGTMSWDFGDGTAKKTGTTATHNYTAAGTYTITQFATEGGCVQTATQTILIRLQPNSAFSFTPAQPCPAPAQIQFNAASVVSGNTYSWNFGDGFNGVGSAPAHWYSNNWMYNVTLGVTDANGCSSTTTRTLSIYVMKGEILADTRTGCAPLKVGFEMRFRSEDTNGKTIAYPYPVTSVNWDFGDGTTGTGFLPGHIYTTVGQFLATATVTTANGCTFTDTMRIYAGLRPTANFGVAPRTVCVNTPVFCTDSSIGTGGYAVNTWVYDMGDGITYHGPNPTHRYIKPGIYTVMLAAGINGCYDTLTRVDYIVVNYPKANMRVRTNCITPLQVSFEDSSEGATSHIWIFGDGTTSTVSHPTHTYPGPGNYTVMLAVSNSSTGCTDTLKWPLNLNPLSLSLTSNKTSLCKGEPFVLTATNSGGGVIKYYSWWVGTGLTPGFGPLSEYSTEQMSMPNPGLYNVAVEVVDQNDCPWRLQRNNYILVGGPVVTFSAAPQVACLPYGQVTFTDNSTHPTGLRGVTRVWDFGDGSTAAVTTTASIAHNYSASASYGIILKVTDNIGCTDSAKIPNFLTVSEPSAIWSTTSSRACENAPYYFFNSSTGNGLSYQWSFGDGGTSTQANPLYVYKSVGSYNVRLIVTDNVGCKDTLMRAGYVTVNARPRAAFSVSDTAKVCSPMIVSFTDMSTGAVRWNWSFGTGAASALQNPSYTFTTPKNYGVRLVAINAAGCTDTAYRNVRLLGYAGALSYSPLTGCAPLTVNFRANDVDLVPGFIFNFGDGSSGATTGKTMTHTYTRAGTYVPSLTMTDNLGCTATSAGLDEIKVDGVISGFSFSPFPACDHGTIRFTDTSRGAFGPIDPPTWSFHDGTRSSDPSPEKTYAGPGSYNVILYHSTATGCRDTLRSKVVFHALPKIDAGIDTTICNSDTATLRPRGGVSYEWSPATTLSCASCTNPAASPSVQTRYTVTGTDTNGCKNTDTVTVRVRLKAEATASPDVEICSGKTVTLSVTGGASYEWSPPTTLHNPGVASPVAYPGSTTRYMVITRLSSCIPDTDYVNVIVHQTPTVDAGQSRTIIAGETTALEGVGTGPISSWLWAPPDGLNCETCYNPEAGPKRSTLYSVTVSSDFGCTATDTVRVTVLCDQSQVFLPNTFTPEGNGVNDIFYPRGRGIQSIGRFRIYNRWGELVFERNNMTVDDRSQGWDGRKDGRLLSPDVYVYTVEATCDTGEPIKWQGDILLLR
jgi:gliding motility-associated-like protein